jgi:hypothetical protein
MKCTPPQEHKKKNVMCDDRSGSTGYSDIGEEEKIKKGSRRRLRLKKGQGEEKETAEGWSTFYLSILTTQARLDIPTDASVQNVDHVCHPISPGFFPSSSSITPRGECGCLLPQLRVSG